jgi:hypothetical protein
MNRESGKQKRENGMERATGHSGGSPAVEGKVFFF